jgi:hypothetical protein
MKVPSPVFKLFVAWLARGGVRLPGAGLTGLLPCR